MADASGDGVRGNDGRFHGYFSYVRGIHSGWEEDRVIRHYVSADLLHWTYENDLTGLGSCRCLDGCVHPLPGGGWGLWFIHYTIKRPVYRHRALYCI